MAAQQALFDRISENIGEGREAYVQKGASSCIRYAIEALGLEGDRRCHSRPGSARQITLINAEHLELVAKWLNRSEIDPSLVRRNIVVCGVNLQALRHQHFAVGEAILLGTALCHPCSRMDENLGLAGPWWLMCQSYSAWAD